ncbi:hypothetical protein D1178_06265 [Stenotrophomonas maltophilia]|nr:hypothetical protein D1178_06265 [Stenotrophomonas maltophilia]
MGCSSDVKRGEVVCVCGGPTVFEGAVIGQVFTGDVQMQCPHAHHHSAQADERERAPTETGRPLSTALIALAIWQATYPAPAVADYCESSLAHAAMFFVAGALTRYLKPKLLRWTHGRIRL